MFLLFFFLTKRKWFPHSLAYSTGKGRDVGQSGWYPIFDIIWTRKDNSLPRSNKFATSNKTGKFFFLFENQKNSHFQDFKKLCTYLRGKNRLYILKNIFFPRKIATRPRNKFSYYYRIHLECIFSEGALCLMHVFCNCSFSFHMSIQIVHLTCTSLGCVSLSTLSE